MISVKIVILVIIWALFVSAVIQFGPAAPGRRLRQAPDRCATALLVVSGFLAGRCYS